MKRTLDMCKVNEEVYLLVPIAHPRSCKGCAANSVLGLCLKLGNCSPEGKPAGIWKPLVKAKEKT